MTPVADNDLAIVVEAEKLRDVIRGLPPTDHRGCHRVPAFPTGVRQECAASRGTLGPA
jgi:hypothetical protein